ncbi:hypothetical protein [Fretibacterium sp. OH1220_COT-178]|uniref:hypothetical protein n=1 Tax=Fretibacterium sp. OH1220_COT-178 TaxID=2491047 RepID=UPI00131567D0|nr:hypothetical protein [Fretibacterium sp. OH1220_COT-178]
MIIDFKFFWKDDMARLLLSVTGQNAGDPEKDSFPAANLLRQQATKNIPAPIFRDGPESRPDPVLLKRPCFLFPLDFEKQYQGYYSPKDFFPNEKGSKSCPTGMTPDLFRGFCVSRHP